jgi:hypothetical protein
MAGAEAHTQFAGLIGPTEVVPLLQSLFDGVFQQAVKPWSFKAAAAQDSKSRSDCPSTAS